MGLKKAILASVSVLALSIPALAQDLNEFQGYVVTLRASLDNVDAARAYLESQSLWNADLEKDLDLAKHNIMMSSYSLGQWILPGLSYQDARSRLEAFCDYNYNARIAWIRINRKIGEENNQKPEWKNLFTKAKRDLPMPCDG